MRLSITSCWNFYLGKREQAKIIFAHFLLSSSPLLWCSWEGPEVGWQVDSMWNLQNFSSVASRLSWQQATVLVQVPHLGFGSVLGSRGGRGEKRNAEMEKESGRGEWEREHRPEV